MAAYTTVDDPSAHFQTTLYTGTGSEQAITNAGNSDLQPDLIWIKRRDAANAHRVMDSTRGGNKYVGTHAATAEATFTFVNSFNSDGANVSGDTSTSASSGTFVMWQWKAGGGSGNRTTFSESGDNPGGGYQANADGGFSIVDFTGTQDAGTIAHGLGAAPKFILMKDRDAGRSWCIYHHQMGSDPNDMVAHFNTTAVPVDYGNSYWNGTDPTSSVFSVHDAHDNNYNDRKYICYVWTEIQGYSKFGKYVGSGNANGPFVYTGFKPGLIITKSIDDTNNWIIHDTKRDPYNPCTEKLSTDSLGLTNDGAIAASGDENIDILSNGFKMRSDDDKTNKSGSDFIYMAWAVEPLVTSGGVPATAR